jgi:hypothetical protein
MMALKPGGDTRRAAWPNERLSTRSTAAFHKASNWSAKLRASGRGGGWVCGIGHPIILLVRRGGKDLIAALVGGVRVQVEDVAGSAKVICPASTRLGTCRHLHLLLNICGGST